MASVFSIENINLNGDMLTASNGSLYINNVLVQNTSGVQLSERFFIKGYAPISFYSRWPQQGYYLNETYLNDFFMATGLLVTCSHPTTGEQVFYGGIYERPASSAIDTSIFAGFELKPKQIIQHTNINYKINKNKIIGLNIYNAPEDMRSISVHLLGYFPAAAHFDKMPKQVNFYAKNIPIFSENLHEEYSQWDSTYSGFGVYCSNTGVGKLIYPEYVKGYISGFLEDEPIYGLMAEFVKPSCDPCDKINVNGWSGYYLLPNIKNNFPSENFSGFSGQNGFSIQSGFQFSGFSSQKEFIDYINNNNEKYGSGEILQIIGWRSGAFPEKVSGFLSGYLNQYGGFLRLSKITTGVSGSGIFFDNDYDAYRNIDTGIFRLDLTGFVMGSSGYFINGKKYFFPSDRPMLYNIVGFVSGFMDGSNQFAPSSSSGYFINTPSDYVKVFFPSVGGFDQFINMYGIYTGSGYSSYYTGFSFPLGSGFSGLNGAQNNTDGIMTGIIGAANVFIPFSGFSGRPDIDLGLGFKYSGMHYDIFEDFFSGLSFDGAGYTGQWIGGIGTRNVSRQQNITGFTKAVALHNFKLLEINDSGISGYYLNNNLYKFKTGVFDPIYYKFPEFSENPYATYGYSYSGFFASKSGFSGIGISGIKKEYIVGFISGYKNIVGEFQQIPSSGFITGNQKRFFPAENLFSGFSGFEGFDSNLGFLYTGMGNNPYRNSNFIGDIFPNSGSGIITGYIGWKNIEFFTKEYGTGIITGFIGTINLPYSGALTGNFYHKDKYGNKTIGPSFGLNIGQYYQESYSLGFSVPWNNRVGIDVYNPLSGISDINIVLFGYYE